MIISKRSSHLQKKSYVQQLIAPLKPVSIFYLNLLYVSTKVLNVVYSILSIVFGDEFEMTRLLILGLLDKRPMSGYDIQQRVSGADAKRWGGILVSFKDYKVCN